MKLNYLAQGADHSQAPVVILIHGMFGYLSNLGVLARPLLEHCRVISVDLRNHGDSPHEQTMDIPSMAEDIVQLMDELAIHSATLIGHSLGGKVAMQVALNCPERVNGLVVADIAPVHTPGGRIGPCRSGGALQIDGPGGDQVESRSTADKLLSDYVDEPGVRAFLLKNLARNADGGFSLKLNISSIEENYSTTLVAAPSGDSYSGPTLFLKGETSAYIQEKHRPVIRQMFPRARLQVVEGAGHWLHAEQPQVVNQLIGQFLQDIGVIKR